MKKWFFILLFLSFSCERANIEEYVYFPETKNISVYAQDKISFSEVFLYRNDQTIFFHYTIDSGLQGRGETLVEFLDINGSIIDTLIEPEGMASGGHTINKISDINVRDVIKIRLTFYTYTTDNILKTHGVVELLR